MSITRFFSRKPKMPKADAHYERPSEWSDLTDDELRHIGYHATCPYCKGDLYEGPQGGMCINLLCKTDGCWSRFNYCGFVGQYTGQDQRGF
jgi:hypothetical protein